MSSCGCYRAEVKATHGKSSSDTYHVWSGMIQRCTNPKNPAYERYGGRGITVCDKWKSFEGFVDDVGERPSPDLSLDRIDTNGNYSADNCVWATASEQARNTRPRNDITGVSGVIFYKPSKKYVARISKNRKEVRLGTYADFFEAVCARKSAENRLWADINNRHQN